MHSPREEENMRRSSPSPSSDHDTKRRKVRKGTHSCWECRRRKIRCQFTSPDDSVCVGCQARGSRCRSQEFVDETPPPPPERKLAQRLGRLEEMMERLIDRIMPDASVKSPKLSSDAPSHNRGTPRPCPSSTGPDQLEFLESVDVLETSTAEDTPVATLLGIQDALSYPSPSTHPSESNGDAVGNNAARETPPKYRCISEALHALFPCQRDLDTIVQASAGAMFVTTLFYSQRDVALGKAGPASSVAVIPPATSHPAVLARKLLQLIICMQQLSPTFYLQHHLQLKDSITNTMVKIASPIAHAVTPNDELMGFEEGLECLILLGFFQSNFGNLRKAWLNFRRALSLAQLMGIDRGNTRALRSCDPTSDPNKMPSPEGLWYRINACDRYLSLLLGLPVGIVGTCFASPEHFPSDKPIEKLEKQHTIISGRIIERNMSKPNEAYALTQAIDCDLEAAGRDMGRAWWNEPTVDPFASAEVMLAQFDHFIKQIQHYSLLILLHLPYMLRAPSEVRYDYSKVTCMRASREVLKRFIAFRKICSSAFSCRHVDYSSLIAAMTLLLSYLGPRPGAHLEESFDLQRGEDKALVEQAKGRMEHVSVLNKDKLSQESADIIKQLLPIIDLVARKSKTQGSSTTLAPTDESHHQQHHVHFNIPYLGTVNINPGAMSAAHHLPKGPGSINAAFFLPAGLPSTPEPSAIGTPSMTAGTRLNEQQQQQGGSAWNASVALLDAAGEHEGQDLMLAAPCMENDFGGMFMQFEPGSSDFAEFAIPDLAADYEDWTFQGVDTTYWSLLNGGMNFGGGGGGQ